MTTYLTREALTRKAPRRYHEFQTILGQCRIQSLTEKEKSHYEAKVMTKGTVKEDAKRLLIVACVVDAEGERLLNDADVISLEEQDGAVTTQIFDECIAHVGFKSEEIDALVKNSAGVPAA